MRKLATLISALVLVVGLFFTAIGYNSASGYAEFAASTGIILAAWLIVVIALWSSRTASN